MICPNCRSEFRAGFTRCADCDRALVEPPAAPGAAQAAAPALPDGREALVPIAEFEDEIKASILACLLDSEGIESVVGKEQPVWVESIGPIEGVKVWVRASDAPKALEIARRPPELPPEDPEDPVLRCPACASPRTCRTRIMTPVGSLSFAFLGIPLPFPKLGRKCVACGHEWPDAPLPG